MSPARVAFVASLLVFVASEPTSIALQEAELQETCLADGSCSAPERSSAYYWPHGRGPPGIFGQSPHSFGGSNCNWTASLKWKWHHPDGRYHTIVVGKPIIDHQSNIYLAILHGIRKFSAQGELIWGWDVEDVRISSVMNSPAIMDGMLYNCQTNGTVFALSMETGKLLWQQTVSTLIEDDQGFVTAHGGRVFMDADRHEVGNRTLVNNKVVALNGSTGDLLWEFFPEPGVWNFLPHFPEDGSMVFQTWNGAAYRVNLSNGEQIWRSGPTSSGWTDGGAALGSNGVMYTVSVKSAYHELHSGAPVTGRLHAFRVSDGKLLWQKEFNEGIYTYPVAGKLSHEGSLSVIVGVGGICGLPVKMALLMFYQHIVLTKGMFLFALLVSILLRSCLKKYIPGPFVLQICKLLFLVIALLLIVAFLLFQRKVGLFKAGQTVFASPPYKFTVHALDAETGMHQWSVDLPPYDWYSAAGDEEGFITRLRNGMRGAVLPLASSYPTLDSRGIYYQAYQDGTLFSIKDWNRDGIIDKSSEMCRFDMGAAGSSGGPSIAPGMLATVSTDGLFVFTEPRE